MTDASSKRPWRTRFENGVIRGDELFDAAARRIFGQRRANHIAAYRSFADARMHCVVQSLSDLCYIPVTVGVILWARNATEVDHASDRR